MDRSSAVKIRIRNLSRFWELEANDAARARHRSLEASDAARARVYRGRFKFLGTVLWRNEEGFVHVGSSGVRVVANLRHIQLFEAEWLMAVDPKFL